MQSSDARVVLVTTPGEDVARAIARTLVEERLAACGNVVAGLTSIFRWDGAIQEEAETLLILKTSAERLEAMRRRVVTLHPYDVPEVLALNVSDGHQPYVDWIGGCLEVQESE